MDGRIIVLVSMKEKKRRGRRNWRSCCFIFLAAMATSYFYSRQEQYFDSYDASKEQEHVGFNGLVGLAL